MFGLILSGDSGVGGEVTRVHLVQGVAGHQLGGGVWNGVETWLLTLTTVTGAAAPQTVPRH